MARWFEFSFTIGWGWILLGAAWALFHYFG